MKEYIISKADSGQTLIKYLGRILKEAPNGLIHKQLRNKNITLNGKKATGFEKLSEADSVKVFMSDETIAKFSKAFESEAKVSVKEYEKAYKTFGKPRIIFENDHIIVFDKPVGVLSQKAKQDDISANEWLIGYLLCEKKESLDLDRFKPSVCNRLDRNTAGLMLFGKTVFGTNLLNKIVKDKSLKKYYKTLVHGKFEYTGLKKSYLLKDEAANKAELFDSKVPGSSEIAAEFKPLRYSKKNNISEVSVLLLTGKSHQIRAQLESMGYPVLGDKKYGNSKDKGLSHHILYAEKLVFPELKDLPELSGREFCIDTSGVFDKYFD